MPPANPASAARRVAEDIREDSLPSADDMLALLPVLDAVAAMGEAEDTRVERWARAIGDRSEIAGQTGHLRSARLSDSACRDIARAAIALADADRVAVVAERWPHT